MAVRYNLPMKVLLANPRGFCAGVDRAIEIVERALTLHGAPIYVRHEVVHNKFVVRDLQQKGAVFVEELHEVPAGATVIFSAHGVSQAVRREAEARKLRVFDATCPLVTKVHVEVAKMRAQGREIVMIGHRGHPEVEGTMGQSAGGMHLVERPEDVARLTVRDADHLAFVTQTTLSVDDAQQTINALRARFPAILGPKKDDICYATQNRQEAVSKLASKSSVAVVLGSQNSSNSQRLAELARERGIRAYLVDGPADLDPAWFRPTDTVLVTAGASAPEQVVEECLDWLRERFGATVEAREIRDENVSFPLPRELRNLAAAK